MDLIWVSPQQKYFREFRHEVPNHFLNPLVRWEELHFGREWLFQYEVYPTTCSQECQKKCPFRNPKIQKQVGILQQWNFGICEDNSKYLEYFLE